MDEHEALARIEALVPAAGDDAAVVDGQAFAVDMLHESTDFPAGITPYTVGWRTVAVSLSDLAAVGATPTATLAAYAPTAFHREDLEAFVEGAMDASAAVGARYVGGDLDLTHELTTVGVATGSVETSIGRGGASPGDVVVVTGTLGRGAVALEWFRAGDTEAANRLFQFTPRVDTGRALARDATAMIDSSDGLARSVHLLAAAGGHGIALERDAIPLDPRLAEVAEGDALEEYGLFWGDDFELVATVPAGATDDLDDLEVDCTPVGRVVDDGVTLDGAPLPDRGYDHGESAG